MRAKRSWIVKMGGALCDEPTLRQSLVRSCADLDRPLVLVHGGGGHVSRLQRRLGGAPRFVMGRRVTTPEEMEIVEMALSGSVNKTLVRDLIAAGVKAVGVSGCDGAMLRCDLVKELGRVGTPAEVDVGLLEDLLGSGHMPVVAPISLGPSGEAVNVNADEVACALAVALRAERLLLLSDVSGVLLEGEPRAQVASTEVEALLGAGHVTDGMVPKLLAAAAATARGVEEVLIAGYRGGPLAKVRGTRVVAEKEAQRA